MMDLLELTPREVTETLPDTQVDFLQAWEGSERDQGRCPVTIPRITWGMGCS
jgi:hypothetical protein